MPAQQEKAISIAFKITVSGCKTEMLLRAIQKLILPVTLVINGK